MQERCNHAQTEESIGLVLQPIHFLACGLQLYLT